MDRCHQRVGLYIKRLGRGLQSIGTVVQAKTLWSGPLLTHGRAKGVLRRLQGVRKKTPMFLSDCLRQTLIGIFGHGVGHLHQDLFTGPCPEAAFQFARRFEWHEYYAGRKVVD